MCLFIYFFNYQFVVLSNKDNRNLADCHCNCYTSMFQSFNVQQVLAHLSTQYKSQVGVCFMLGQYVGHKVKPLKSC